MSESAVDDALGRNQFPALATQLIDKLIQLRRFGARRVDIKKAVRLQFEGLIFVFHLEFVNSDFESKNSEIRRVLFLRRSQPGFFLEQFFYHVFEIFAFLGSCADADVADDAVAV